MRELRRSPLPYRRMSPPGSCFRSVIASTESPRMSRGVPPRWALQGLGDHVLRDVVHAIGEPLVLRSSWPERREDLKGHPPQEDRARLEELVDLESLLVLAGVP
jgi:hypothetical protein